MCVPCNPCARGLYASHAIPMHAACVHLMHVAYVIPMHFLYNTQDLPPDDSSLCLRTEMVDISRVEARVFTLDWKGEWKDMETLTPKGVFIVFLLGLSDLNPPWAWVT